MSAPYDPDRSSAPPVEVVRAVQLMFARIGIGIVNAAIALASGTAIKDAMRAEDPTLPPAEVDEKYTQSVAIAICLAALLAVLYLLLALRVLHGRSWARIVTWVVAGLGLFGGLLGLFATGTDLEKAVVVVGLLVDAAIVVLLGRERSNTYFR